MARDLTLFSWGYWGWGNATRDLLRLTADIEARRGFRPPLFADIRVRRAVRAAGFNGHAFERLAGKSRYRWMPDLGNQSIVDGRGKMRIRRPAAADDLLELAMECAGRKQRVVFFCSCLYPCDCHRAMVAKLVIVAGRRRRQPVTVAEWPGGEPTTRRARFEVSAPELRRLRKSMGGVNLPDEAAVSRAALLPVGSLVEVEAAGEEALTVAVAAVTPEGGRWSLPVLWGDDDPIEPTARAAKRWRREFGYEPLHYRPSR